MTDLSQLDRMVFEVGSIAKECGALVVEAVVRIDERAAPVAAVAGDRFPELIKHARPKIVYVFSASFDAREETSDALDSDDDGVLDHPKVRKFVSKWKKRDGETFNVALTLMCDGVVHGAMEEAEWFSEFQAEAETLAEEIEGIQRELERKQSDENRRRLSDYVKRLMSDPRFSASKVGVAKRTVLAGELFPDLDRDSIRAVVEQAENDHWLATAGRKT